MNKILQPVIRKFALVYSDDVIFYSTSIEQHLKDIEKVLNILKQAGLKKNFLNLHSCKPQLTWTWHITDRDNTRSQENKSN